MPYSLGNTSRSRLEGVDPALVAVVNLAIKKTKQDFTVLCGARTKTQQYKLYAQGRTVAQLRTAGVPSGILARPGLPKVTWTLNSRHFPDPVTGKAKAVDLAPWPIDWEGPARFPKHDLIAEAMFAAAKELGVKIRWGADWDQDGNPRERGESDSPHFELV